MLVAYVTVITERVDELYQTSVKEMEAPQGPPVVQLGESVTGVGARQAGRLLGGGGGPILAPPEPPRKVSELISYCGYAVDDEGVALRPGKRSEGQLEP